MDRCTAASFLLTLPLLLSPFERPYRVRNMKDDRELLREYAEGGSDEAFRLIVERHAGMVHGAALRIVREPSFAEEIAQAVFILLARKSASLPRSVVLAGWLHQTTRFVALAALRSERRRHL